MSRAGKDAAGGRQDEARAMAAAAELGWRDDVAYQAELQARYPDLAVTAPDHPAGRWYATWTGTDGTEQRAGAGSLGELLDVAAPALAARSVSPA
jgi:hypothetical protein